MNALIFAAVLLSTVAAPPSDVTLPGLEDEHAGLTSEQVLKSPEWRQAMLSLSTWFDTQKLYDKSQVLDLKRKINERVLEMSPTELLRFQHEIAEKVAILNGPEAQAIKIWLREQLSLASDEYARKILAGLPDVSKLSPDELQDYLNKFAINIEAQRRGAQELSQARTAQAQMVTSTLNRQRQESERAISQAMRSGGWGGNGGVVGSKNVTGGQIPTAAGYYSNDFNWMGWGGYRW